MTKDKSIQFPYAKELKAITKNNKKALQNLYTQEAALMLSFAVKAMGHYKLAEEAVVDTFTLIWKNAQYYTEDQHHPRGWIYAIFRYHLNQIIQKNYHSLKENKKENEQTLGEVCTNLHAGVESFVEQGSFYQVLEELPDETQKVLITTYFSPESHAEIATLLQIPLGRLKENIQLGIRYFAQKRTPLKAVKHDHTQLIGEFVLGGQSEEDQKKALSILESDTTAEKISLIWEEEFLHFLEQLSLEKLPETLWVRIKKEILPPKTTDLQELDDELALQQSHTTNSWSDRLTFFIKKCWISRNFWRSASLALIGVIALLLIFRPLENPIRLASILTSTTQTNQVAFTLTQNNKLTITPSIQQNLGTELQLQLWYRDEQGIIHPIAIVASNKSTQLPYMSQLKAGNMVFISIEPQSAQMSNQMTGQIMYQGLLAEF